jgi:hypothetical protein
VGGGWPGLGLPTVRVTRRRPASRRLAKTGEAGEINSISS